MIEIGEVPPYAKVRINLLVKFDGANSGNHLFAYTLKYHMSSVKDKQPVKINKAIIFEITVGDN